MTDITDEQRAAVDWLQRAADPAVWERNRPFLTSDRARVILAALPSELTNQQPVLPTEPGYYISEELSTVWMLRHTGEWLRFGDGKPAHREFVLDSAPFTRLVPERPQITREQIVAVFDTYGDDYDLETISDLVDLANGTDRD